MTGYKALSLYELQKIIWVDWSNCVGNIGCLTHNLFFSLCNSQLSESSEKESDAWKVTSRSEELLPTPVSSTSTDSSFGEGVENKKNNKKIPKKESADGLPLGLSID